MSFKKFIPPKVKNLYHFFQAFKAVRKYNFPSRKLRMVGITGTDGKTTTTNLTYSVLKVASYPVGMISTIRAEFGDESLPTGLHVTTPDAEDVQRYLQKMVDKNLTYGVLEVTSHGLRQGRVFGVDFDVAVVTNITPEHLDEHGTFDQYRADKGLLFKNLAKSYKKNEVPKVIIINRDDIGSFEYLSQFNSDQRLTYGCTDESDVWASEIDLSEEKSKFTLNYKNQQIKVNLHLPGRYNIYNSLAAACVGISQKTSLETIKNGLEDLKTVEGRMEYITKESDRFTVIVDFAHTPNALDKALTYLRDKVQRQNKKNKKDGKLIVVFGCAGERDPYKREAMGEIGGRLADLVVVTSEDPRSEKPENIIGQIEQGLKKVNKVYQKDYWTFVDRREAINFAVRTLAKEGDIVDLTGKGHEQSLCIQGVEYPWDERQVAREALKNK